MKYAFIKDHESQHSVRRMCRLFDVLGLALRIRPRTGPALDEHAALGDQDLLFATIRSPWTTLLAPFTTNARDFLQRLVLALLGEDVERLDEG